MFGNVRELPRQLRKACALPYLEGVVSEGRGWDVRFQKIPWGIAVPPILDSTFKHVPVNKTFFYYNYY